VAISIVLMKLQDIFISNIKTYRAKLGLSQTKLAKRCDTISGYIWEIETGRKFPSIDMIEKIPSALRIEAHRLFVKDSHENPPPEAAVPAQKESSNFDIYDLELYLSGLAPDLKNEFKSRLLAIVGKSLEKMLGD